MNRHKTAALRFALSLIAAVMVIGASHADQKSSAMLRDNADGKNWAGYGRTNGTQHYSPLDQVKTDNVAKLGLAWFLDLQPGGTVTQPIVVDGVIYFAMGYSVVHAVDEVTGKLLWKYDPEVYKTAGKKLHSGWGSRGIGWWNGKIYTVTLDGYVIALDAKTGKPLWKTPTIDKDDSITVTGAPFIFDGILIIGNAGDYGPTRGNVTALDAETGKKLWNFFTVPGDPSKGFENKAMEMAAKTWFGEWWKFGGGGAPWNAFAYDPNLETIYVGTGNSVPYNRRFRSQDKGDNLFVASILALDAKTGAYKWHYQANPGEQWDYTVTQDIELADLVIDGKSRKVLMTAPKNGFYYVIDRITGKLISAEPFVRVTWASKVDLTTGRPVENPEARYKDKPVVLSPTYIGGHSWHAMSYSPKTRLTYIPTVEFAATFADIPDKELIAPTDVSVWSGINIGAAPPETAYPNFATAALIAWDPVKQKQVWRVPAPRMIDVAATATGGDLVFQGSVDSTFNAYDANDGKRLWSFDTQAPPISPAVTYAVNGKQYVTVLTGLGTSAAVWGTAMVDYKLDYRTMPRRVLTFALDAKTPLPPRQEPDLGKPDDKAFRPNAASAQAGAAIYGRYCIACHGVSAVSSGFTPDLRRSVIPLSEDSFAAVVHDGALVQNYMPQFNGFTPVQLNDLRQYIRTQAHNPALDKAAGASVSPFGR